MDDNPIETQVSNQGTSQERLQELAIVVSDRLRTLNRRWWYAIGIVFVLCFPLYFSLRAAFTAGFVASHKFPAYTQPDETKIPLSLGDVKIFDLGNGNYSGYARIKNSSNLEWGVPNQVYTGIFSSNGTEIRRVSDTTYILPASTKIIYFSRFTSSTKPTSLSIQLANSNFLRKPNNISDPKFTIERNDMQVVNGQLVINASIRNDSPFTINRVDLPVLVYDSNNNVIAANYTNINDLKYQETRSFQFAWPNNPSNPIRDEILPEINLFDPNVYALPPGTSPF